ncbi:hypothetical protein ACH4OW_33915 [Streptomyces sp. NPDC017056]|uniref:hypothetical protein n=1 Tax=Streptomyces sp. NPDC017056 TaxID=3364973 RepID=UPI0037AA5C4F
MLADTVITCLSKTPPVEAAALCGSFRQGTEDQFSDMDVWMFLEVGTDISARFCIEDLLPAEAQELVIEEGRDDSEVDYVVLNLRCADRILNLKFLRIEQVADFSARKPSLDVGYLDDLENYWTMRILHDREGRLEQLKGHLELHAIRIIGDDLYPEMLLRYASFYWRSVFQGVLRNETNAWRSLMLYMIELLVGVAHLRNDRLPPPKKWLLSNASLRSTGAAEPHLAAALQQVWQAEEGNAHSLLQGYRHLSYAEAEILDPEYLPQGFWWRRVFTERLHNIPTDPDVQHAVDDVLRGFLMERMR